MNKYIIELLKTESTVIIPEFGALMKTGRSLIFNPILKFNDGKLQKYIAKKEDRDEQDVANMIAKHVREIIADIGKGNSYRVFGLGEFYKNEEGKIVFEQEKKTSEHTPENDSPKKAPSTPIIEKKQENPISQEKKPVANKEEIKPEEKAQASKDEDPVPKTITSTFLEQSIKNSPKPKEKKEEEKLTEKKETTKSKANKPKRKKPKKERGNKSKKGLVIWSIVFVVIAGLGVFAGLNLEKVKSWVGLSKVQVTEDITPNDEETEHSNQEEEEDMAFAITDSTDDNVDETLEEDTTSVSDSEEYIEEEEIDEEPIELTKDMIYHITVGSFGDRSNAQALVEKMKNDGLTNARILKTSGSMAKVVAGSYSSEKAAEQDMEKAKKYNTEAYVIKVREQ